MDVRISSQNLGILASDLPRGTGKREASEGEDDDFDRNPKHGKRAADGDSLDQTFNRPYRKRSKPSENGYSERSGVMASGREVPRFERRHLNQTPFSRGHMDLHQRISNNQSLPSEARPGSRGKELGAQAPYDYRLGSVELTSHMFPLGPVPSGLVVGRGLPDVANAKHLSWNPFGLLGAPNGGLDALQPCGLQAALRPSINPPHIGIQRQNCRDFEERGFCLRGDLCPMEHGVNRIIIDDVQSLSQFNLPVSLPGSQLMVTSVGQGDSLAEGSDVYDPDQPLWTSDNPATVSLLSLHQPNADNMESFPGMDTAERSYIKRCEGFEELPVRSASASGSQSTPVWRRKGGFYNRLGVKEKKGSEVRSPSYLERETKSEAALNTELQDVSQWEKQVNITDECPEVKKAPLKPYSHFARDAQKQSKKAFCTLFVNGIPWKDNKRESLLSHFRKFGDIIDIYIPMHSERAFVQFSKTEEAEAALKAPDAVMGNRFIKLRWANRDNIPSDRINDAGGLSTTPRGTTLGSDFSHPPFDSRKEYPQSAGIKDVSTHMSVSQVPIYDHPRPVSYNGPKIYPIQQKKLENLELLREELRKKQEILDQKRNEFRRQLEKLDKQSTGSKVEAISPKINEAAEDVAPAVQALPHTSSTPTVTARELSSSRPTELHWTLSAPSFTNRFKLDNRPTGFGIISVLPDGLANAAALEEHFKTYGDLSSVELEELQPKESNETPSGSGVSARISFTTRRSAERAFIYGKSWKSHPLQFTWLKPSTSGKESDAPVNPSAHPKLPQTTAAAHCLNSAAAENGGPENITASSSVESALE